MLEEVDIFTIILFPNLPFCFNLLQALLLFLVIQSRNESDMSRGESEKGLSVYK